MPVLLYPLEPTPEDRVGAPEWRQHTRDTVNKANQLAQKCDADAVAVWQPQGSNPDPNNAPPQSRKTHMAPWRFRVEMLKGGWTVQQPPPGDGVTLWKAKIKPPAWQASLPLPLHREARAMQTNEYIQNYTRSARLFGARLRQAEQEINGQLQKLVRQREVTDFRLSEIRKGLLINKQSQNNRHYRPASEKVPDKVDNLLIWEKDELRILKRKLEKDMETSENLLKALTKCRDDLIFCCEERLRVVDLMNHCIDSVLVDAGRQSWINISRLHTPKVQGTTSPPVNPLGVNPPECNSTLNEAKRLLADGKIILEHMIKSEHHAQTWQMHVKKTVENALHKKMEETVQLKERLNMMTGLMRGTINRCRKYKEEMLITQEFIKGPLCQNHLEAREKLLRPMVRVFQRHVGTQLPEASRLSMGSKRLKQQSIKLEKDLEKLRSTKDHLNSCLRDKQIGHQVDYDMLRLRIRQSQPHVSVLKS
ncbi:tektin-like protein 1 isoform X2 [Macrotis lagotis]|uniref:tektin-like protein 1 isoform X2 n=1 Tax=Macrotis lagotis TaxID=92651 RepID=UPI003D6966BA